VPVGGPDALFDWCIGEAAFAAAVGDRTFESPEFKAGDGMLFDERCLHRTGYHPGQTKTRYAIETWMFAPSSTVAAPIML
jgi:hypothetical protein